MMPTVLVICVTKTLTLSGDERLNAALKCDAVTATRAGLAARAWREAANFDRLISKRRSRNGADQLRGTKYLSTLTAAAVEAAWFRKQTPWLWWPRFQVFCFVRVQPSAFTSRDAKELALKTGKARWQRLRALLRRLKVV